MSDPNEQSERTQQGAESAQDDAESRVEATEAAKRKAQELGVDLASVEGTGPGGRVTAPDVENAQRQSDTTARSEEATQSVSRPLNPCRQDACEVDSAVVAGCVPPTDKAILAQYAVLTAILGSPEKGFFDLSTEIVVKVDAAGNKTETITVLPNTGGVNFPGAVGSGTPLACNFFAPMPPSAPVKFRFPHPQPLLPSGLNSCQPCLDEKCDPCGVSLFDEQQIRALSQSSRDPYRGGNQSR